MKYKHFSYWLFIAGLLVIITCTHQYSTQTNIRPLADTIGFAQYDWQMDSIMARIHTKQGNLVNKSLSDGGITESDTWKVVISPHDDYSYVGYLYPAVLQNIKAKTIILIGVAHKAKLLNLEDQIIFDSYEYWQGLYGEVKVSTIREDILELLPTDIFQVNDSMQRMEHSVEAIIPFLQYYNKNVEILSLLVPYMSFDRMNKLAEPLASAIHKVAVEKNWEWGKDYAIVISNDAVHYGDEDWGDKNFAFFGTDSLGYINALSHEKEIMSTITGELSPEKVKKFTEFTVQEYDYKIYKWTWCGRFSVPFGLLTSIYLSKQINDQPLSGISIGYTTSIDREPIKVNDLDMGVTAPANKHHWVGYTAIGYQ